MSGDDIADKLARKNALEKERRDEIEEWYNNLRDSLPAFRGKNVKPSQLQILETAAEYLQSMPADHSVLQQDIDDLMKENKTLEEKIEFLQKAKATGNYDGVPAVLEEIQNSVSRLGAVSGLDGDSEDSSDNSDESKDGPQKKFKPN